MTAVSFLPSAFVTGASRVGRTLLGRDRVPLYDGRLPRGGKRRHPKKDDDAVAVYFPSCIGAMFAAEGNAGGAQDAFLALCERADIRVTIPEGIGRMCCGTPWKSKGYESGYNTMMHRVVSSLADCSRDGALPIVCDASSCTEGLIAMVRNSKDPRARVLRFVDSIEFVNDRMLDTLTVRQPLSSIMLHPTCSSTRLGIDDKLNRIATRISPNITVPADWGCCGFAGDRGMLHPELTESATAAQVAEIASVGADHYASCNRTCEIGMSRATGKPYRHLLELLEVATR
jgi:D-lactate dehydrogenase